MIVGTLDLEGGVRGGPPGDLYVILHVKAQTLKSRLHRGRLMLREELTTFASGLQLH